MRSTLRSEVDVFRLVLVIGAGCAIVVALALATEPLYGAVLGAVLIASGIVFAWRGTRGSEPHRVRLAPPRADGRHRILVVALESVAGRALLDKLGARARAGDCEILVVAPALTRSQRQHWASDIDGALSEAERRRDESVRAIEAEGLDVSGEVGDSDPNVAIESTLLRFPANEVVICSRPPERSQRLERRVVERARAEVELPVSYFMVEAEAEGAAPAP